MDSKKRFDQIENLLTSLLKGQDRQTLVMDSMLNALVEHSQTMKGIQENVQVMREKLEGMDNGMKEVRDEIRGLRQDVAEMAE